MRPSHRLADGGFELISGMILLNVVHVHAERGGYDIAIVRDNNAAADNPSGRRAHFRFGMDGPHAGRTFAKVVEGEAPRIAFSAPPASASPATRCWRSATAGRSSWRGALRPL